MKNNILCVDMKSFYASCECIFRDLDPETTKLVVVGDIKNKGSVVLASSPIMKKKYNIKTGSRMYEVLNIKDKEIIITQARMNRYYEMTKKIIDIFKSFAPENHIHVYSVDESWLNINGTEKLWGNPKETALKIIKRIKKETGLIATVGIGDNKFLAKAALDIYAKHQKNGIGEIRIEDVEDKLHYINVEKMWGIGEKLKERLNALGIKTIGDLAEYDLNKIKKIFGKNGEILWSYSWGIDDSQIVYSDENPAKSVFGFGDFNSTTSKSIGRGATLKKDYNNQKDILVVIKDLLLEITKKMREKKIKAKTIQLSLTFSNKIGIEDITRQKTFKSGSTRNFEKLIIGFEKILQDNYDEGLPIRKIRISVSNLDYEKEIEKDEIIEIVTDQLNNKFGKGKVTKGFSLYEQSLSKDRSKKINGHFE